MTISLAGTNGLVASGNEKLSDATLTVTFTAVTQVGDRLYMGLSCDNLGTATPTINTIVDSKGNTWTAVTGGSPNASSATAAAAVVLRVYKCTVTVAHAVNDTLAITLSASVTAKAAIVYGFRGATFAAETGVVSSQGTTGSPALSVSPALVGDIVVGFLATENSAVAAGDADTLNGSWSTAVGTASVGSTAITNAAITAQSKVVTATGAQSWGATGTSDWAAVAFTVSVIPQAQVSWAALEAPLVKPPVPQAQVSWASFQAPPAAKSYIKQAAFRFRNDDGDQATATWKTLENYGYATAGSLANFRLRILLQESEGLAAATGGVFLEFSYNGGAWSALTNTFSAGVPARIALTPNLVDNEATTQQMSGTGTFVAGLVDENPGFGTAGVNLPALGNTEYEFSVALDSTQLVTGNKIAFRINRVTSVVFDSYQIATLTVTAGGSNINWWNGTAFLPKPLKRWNGTAWVPAVLKSRRATVWS